MVLDGEIGSYKPMIYITYKGIRFEGGEGRNWRVEDKVFVLCVYIYTQEDREGVVGG